MKKPIYRTCSVIIHGSPQRHFSSFVLPLMFILIFGLGCDNRLPVNQSRIACFPLESQYTWLDIVVGDGINSLLNSLDHHRILAYPIDWSYDAVDKDSVSNLEYLLSYGKRIGLDYIIVNRTKTAIGSHEWSIEWSLYDLNDNKRLISKIDTLRRDHEPYFYHIKHQVTSQFSPDRRECALPELVDFDAWQSYGLGRYYQIHDDIHKAENAFRRAMAVDPHHKDIYKALVRVLLDKARLRKSNDKFADDIFIEAAGLLRAMMVTDTMDSEVYSLYGQLYIQCEMWNKAERMLHKAYSLEKNDPIIYWNLSRLHPSRYRSTGFKDNRQLLSRALFLHPGFERARLDLAEGYFYHNTSFKAIEEYEKLLRIHPRSMEALLALGKLYMSKNDAVNIIRVYERILQISPEYSDAYYNLGIAYYNDERIDEAIQFFMRAVEIDDHADSHLYLGVIYKERGDEDLAINHFRRRIQMKKNFNDPYAEEARKQLTLLLNGEDKS